VVVGAFIERTSGTRKFLQLFSAPVSSPTSRSRPWPISTYRAGAVFDGASYAVLALFGPWRMYGRSPPSAGWAVHQAR